ncbi:MAG: cell division protein FtsQ/DivIB [Verrucomicrobiales bacterium]|nr:FtsQ-type POTRA domain-containing protein [Verrucomicrobiota bacterium JB022]
MIRKRRKTSKVRKRSKQSVLQVRVMSPRIAWFGFLGFLGKFARLAVILGLMGAAGWGVWQGIRHAFYQNPDFELRMIKLNTNPVIDEAGVAEVVGIDLLEMPSLFDIDVEQAAMKLCALPEVSDARVERHLPDTLVVRLVARTPEAWISCPEIGLLAKREAGAMLVSKEGVAYPCPELQVESAEGLPVIELPASEEHGIVVGGKVGHPELTHCVRLLEAARQADPEGVQWIESIRQENEWSLLLTTKQGTLATFGLGDHERQIESLRAALDHAGEKGYLIATINLIPKYNIPITLQGDGPPPRAIPVTVDVAEQGPGVRQARDLSTLLRRD